LIPDLLGYTPMHLAAASGTLDQLPASRLVPELLMAPDEYNRTPLHIAADQKHLAQIPGRCFTKATLSARDVQGTAVLADIVSGFWCDSGFYPGDIPEPLLVELYGPIIRPTIRDIQTLPYSRPPSMSAGLQTWLTGIQKAFLKQSTSGKKPVLAI
jgi:hypothetical protein